LARVNEPRMGAAKNRMQIRSRDNYRAPPPGGLNEGDVSEGDLPAAGPGDDDDKRDTQMRRGRSLKGR